MKNLTWLLLFWCTLPMFAQLPDKPKLPASEKLVIFSNDEPKPHLSGKQIIFSNAAMFAASVLGAHAAAYSSNQCYIEATKAGDVNQFGITGVVGGQFHPWKRAFTLSLPTDAAISLSSYFLHIKHHDVLALILPTGSAGVQVGIAGVQYTQGCF